VLKYNPESEYFCEHLKFDDMIDDWRTVCEALSEPCVLDAADHSGSRRLRAYWTNVPYPLNHEELSRGFGPIDPNECMDPGRTIEPYHVAGKTTIRTIGKSWTGDPDNPVPDTTVPVVVHDVNCEQKQFLRRMKPNKFLVSKKGLPQAVAFPLSIG